MNPARADGIPERFFMSKLHIVLCLGQDSGGHYLNFRETFANSWGHTKSIQVLPVEFE